MPGAKMRHYGAFLLDCINPSCYNATMNEFKALLQQEYLRRQSKNPNYSIRAYARQLGIYHATLSALLAGKRPITEKTAKKIVQKLDLDPHTQSQFFPATTSISTPYFHLQQDAFNSISEWYFDAILEMTRINGIKISPQIVASALGIARVDARMALETLERLELLQKTKNGFYSLTHSNSTNILDEDFTNAAMKKYQRKILEKSIQALENTPKPERDHTSITMAVQTQDIPAVKKMIKKFRQDIDAYAQRKSALPNEVYQLQVSFFPLTKLKAKGSPNA